MRTALGLILSAGLLGPALGASAQIPGNVVENGEFDSNTSGWFAFDPGNIAWDPADVDDSPGSGSMLVTNPLSCPASGICFVAASQCIPVARQDQYDFGAFVFIPDQPGVDVRADVGLRYFLDSSCVESGGGAFVSVTGPTGGWFDATKTAQFAPPGLRAVRVELGCGKQGPEEQDAECLFDSVFVVPEPGLSAARCTALACLLLVSRRRRRAPRG